MTGSDAKRDAGDRSRAAGIARLVVANLAVVVILCSIIEGTFRVITAEHRFFLFSAPQMRIDGRAFVEPHPTRGFALNAGYSGDEVRIDDRGFRETGWTPDGDDRADLVILTLGESTTFGWRVPQGADYPSALENLLADRTGLAIDVVNGGVPSYSSSQVAVTVEELAAEGFRGDLVLVSIMWNDIYYSATPNWYPELLVFQQPPMWKRWLFRHSATFRHLARMRVARLGEADQPNPAAFELYADNLERLLSADSSSLGRIALVEPPYCRARIKPDGMVGLGLRLSPDYFHARAERYAERMRRIARTHGAPVIDHRLSIRHTAPAELFLDRNHPTAEGNRIMAEDIADGLIAAGLVSPPVSTSE